MWITIGIVFIVCWVIIGREVYNAPTIDDDGNIEDKDND